MADQPSDSSSGQPSARQASTSKEAEWNPVRHMERAKVDSIDHEDSKRRTPVFIVTTLHSWVVLVCLALLVGAVSFWLFTGEIVEVISGDGMLIDRTRLYPVTSSDSARVVELKVTVGEEVRAGQLLAELDPTELKARIKGARNLYDLQVEENERLTQTDIQELDQVLNQVSKSVEEQRAAIEISRSLIESYGRQLELQKDLLDRGLVTLAAYLQTKSQVLVLEQSIYSAHAKIAESELLRTAARQSFETDLAARLEGVSLTDSELGVLLAQLEQKNKIYSPVSGVIAAIDVDVQEFISSGQQIMRIESGDRSTNQLHCLAYVPSRMGKRIKVGMRCQMLPEITYYNRFGYVLGTVRKVDMFPANRNDLMMQFADDSLVDSMIATTPNGLLIDITLETDSSTPSGYRWSTRTGFPEPLEAGTPTQVRVIYAELAPIDLISPLLGDYLFGRNPGPGPGSE